MSEALTQALDIFRQIKRTWSRDQWCIGEFARNLCGNGVYPDHVNAVQFCGLGIIARIAGYTQNLIDGLVPNGAGIVAEQMLELKLAQMFPTPEGYRLGSEKMIPYINDLADGSGYEKIMAAIDAILIEHAPKAIPMAEVVERELQPA